MLRRETVDTFGGTSSAGWRCCCEWSGANPVTKDRHEQDRRGTNKRAAVVVVEAKERKLFLVVRANMVASVFVVGSKKDRAGESVVCLSVYPFVHESDVCDVEGSSGVHNNRRAMIVAEAPVVSLLLCPNAQMLHDHP